jgi:hypothetical protein
MKELFFRALLGCFGFLIVYVLGSFFNTTFNIANWSEESRFITVLIGGFVFLMFYTYPGYNFKNK